MSLINRSFRFVFRAKHQTIKPTKHSIQSQLLLSSSTARLHTNTIKFNNNNNINTKSQSYHYPYLSKRCYLFNSNLSTIIASNNAKSPNNLNRQPNTGIMMQKHSVFVQIDKTPNINALKFTPAGHPLLPPKMTLNISSYKEAMKKSDLARELFIIEGVTNVFMTDSFISVTIDDTGKWADVQGNIVAIINDFLTSNQDIYKITPVTEGGGVDGDGDTGDAEENYDDDDEIVAMIRELIDTRIRPNVQYDGGDVVYRGFDPESGIVRLELAGACKGCASSNITLYNGIERMLTFYIPEVTGIEEVTSEENQRLQEISQAAYDAVTAKLEENEKHKGDGEEKDGESANDGK